MITFFREIISLVKFLKVESLAKEIVFYSEDKESYVYFKQIIESLLEKSEKSIYYITSDIEDPVLYDKKQRLHALYIGSNLLKIIFFNLLNCKVLIMTMPDLHALHIKRSMVYPVHYIYLFHSLVSTHLIYRKDAFFYYDTIFCSGSHQALEIRKAEDIYKLKRKKIVNQGYVRLDSLISEKKIYTPVKRTTPKKILIAPSWGTNGLLETLGVRLVGVLLRAGYEVILRPHPRTVMLSSCVDEIAEEFSAHPGLNIEKDIRNMKSFFESDILISDWSGAALEYAFCNLKPVLFVDVPLKMRNDDWKEIEVEPIEISIRNKVGKVLSVESFEKKIVGAIEELVKKEMSAQIEDVRNKYVFNIGKSGLVGACEILNIVERLP